MRTVAIVQARMGSSRLPGKVLKDIAGKTMLARVVERAKRSERLDEVIVATTTEAADDVLVAVADSLGVQTHRGSVLDVLDRYIGAARKASATTVVRITSDCPLIDPDVIDQTVGEFFQSGADYACNTLVSTFPRGLDVEAFTVDALELAHNEAKRDYERVHVTPFIHMNPSRFRLHPVRSTENAGDLRWTVDTQEDLDLIRALYEETGRRDYVGWQEVLALVRSRPDLAKQNAHIRQKAVEEC